MKDLSQNASRLLEILIGEIHSGRIDPDHPETFPSYGDVLEKMNLPESAPVGGTHGQTLQLNGLDELGPWTKSHPAKLPAITGLIVSRETHQPGPGFFKLYGKRSEDIHWWLAEVAKCLSFDWSPFASGATIAPSPPDLVRAMSSLERGTIEKAGNNNGFEHKRKNEPGLVHLSSARHKAEVLVTPSHAGVNSWHVRFPQGPPQGELMRSFPDLELAGPAICVSGEKALGKLLRRAAELAKSLPNQAAEAYAEEIAKIEDSPPTTTEALAIVKQRRGQELFRKALMDYWGGACAVTGIAVPELLRASHAKPWSECASDEERLNVFNGFLLCAHLDALFDRGLMTFNEKGGAVVSASIAPCTREALNLTEGMKLRWLAAEHGAFLQWHRENVFQIHH
jgi:hypothetical protein